MSSALGSLRTVILHADDFGMNDAVNAGILRAYQEGCLTSTSLLVNAPAAEAALAGAQQLSNESDSFSGDRRKQRADSPRTLDLGLHLNFTQGRPLTENFPAELRTPEGHFLSIGRLFSRLSRSGKKYASCLRAEISAQLDWMLARGVTPTHVNGHQYVELIPVISAELSEVFKAHQIRCVRFPCEAGLWRSTFCRGRIAAGLLALVKRGYAKRYRQFMQAHGFIGPQHYFGTAHAGRVTLPLLREWISQTAPGETLEVGLHPAEQVQVSTMGPWCDPLDHNRPQELALLVSNELQEMLLQSNCRLGRLVELTR